MWCPSTNVAFKKKKLTKVHLRKFDALHLRNPRISGTSRSSVVNVITIHHRHHCSLDLNLDHSAESKARIWNNWWMTSGSVEIGCQPCATFHSKPMATVAQQESSEEKLTVGKGREAGNLSLHIWIHLLFFFISCLSASFLSLCFIL